MSSDKHMIEQEWSVHAQLTFSHGVESDTSAIPRRMPNGPHHPCYGFQRGNIVFTTGPPTQTATNYGSLPSASCRRTQQPYNRRCMSTCNIVLGRTPSVNQCQHTHAVTAAVTSDTCDVCTGAGRSPTAARRAYTFTSHFCTRVPDKTPLVSSVKDVASQTSSSSLCVDKSTTSSSLQVPTLSDSNTSSQSGKRLSRSLARLRGKSPLLKEARVQDSESKLQKKPPRTVHIDVYCTGSEKSGSDASSNAEDEDSILSAETVYESEGTRVCHKRETDRLPQALTRQKRRTLSEGTSASASSCFYPPSQRSSQSSVVAGRDSASCLTSSNCGFTSGTSSCALFSDDSAAATSWKDTSVEFELLGQSDISLTRSESFEYADYSDKLRIKEKEIAWGTGDGPKSWRSPQTERKHRMQQEKYQQYIQRRSSPFPQWNPDDTSEDSGDSSDTEMAWSFGRLEDISKHAAGVKREDTVRRNSKTGSTVSSKRKTPITIARCDSGSFSDSGHVSFSHQRDQIGPFGKKANSPPKVKFESSNTATFMSRPGVVSEHLLKAEKFGTIISSLKKPGHHVGPSKNPDCLCDTCQLYFEEKWYTGRNRARSLGDMPITKREQWKATLYSIVQSKQNEVADELPLSECDPSLV